MLSRRIASTAASPVRLGMPVRDERPAFVSGPQEARMLVLYYFEELTMKQIGLLFGVVESRISQMHATVIRRLRPRLKGLREHTRQPRMKSPPVSAGVAAKIPV